MSDIVEMSNLKRYEQGSLGMRPDPEGVWVEYDEVQVKIERLRGELFVEKSWVHQYRDVYNKQVAEIARLRGLLTEWVSAVSVADFPETLYELVAYGSENDLGDHKSLVARTNDALNDAY